MSANKLGIGFLLENWFSFGFSNCRYYSYVKMLRYPVFFWQISFFWRLAFLYTVKGNIKPVPARLHHIIARCLLSIRGRARAPSRLRSNDHQLNCMVRYGIARYDTPYRQHNIRSQHETHWHHNCIRISHKKWHPDHNKQKLSAGTTTQT